MQNGIMPVIVEDSNRNEYREALRDYREKQNVAKLIALLQKEQQYYVEKCEYLVSIFFNHKD